MRKRFWSILLLVMVFIISNQPITNAVVKAETSRQLCDLQIFKDKAPAGWCGSGNGELETQNDMLPVDTAVICNGLPSLKFNVSKQIDTWMSAQLAIRDWNAHDLTQYLPNGYIEFNIKGNIGGEDVLIGAKDIVHERNDASGNPLENVELYQPISKYATITKEWQHLKIPIKDIIDETKGFVTKSAQALLIASATGQPLTVWVNDFKITSTDNEKGFAKIKVNQVGYLTYGEKCAIVSGFADELKADTNTEFQVKNAVNNATVYTGKLTLVKEYDSTDSGEKVLQADFSAVTTPGSYYVTVPAENMEKSLQFKIGNDVYTSLLADSARYFYYQRQGIDLQEKYALAYPRKESTPQDSTAIFESNPNKVIDVSKGWHDAGDKGKDLLNGALAVSDMFWAYEMFPSTFKDNQFNIPESGNGIVDVLDEARWELEWILKMQDSASGGFYARVKSDTFPAEQVVNQRIICDKSGDIGDIKSTEDTACAAAILSHAYIMYKDIDAKFANQCLDSAKKAWTFLENNPKTITSPPGPYNVYDDSSDRLWGAATLFRVTGDEKYNTYFKNNYQKFSEKFESKESYGHNWGNMWTTAFWSYLKAEKKDANVESWIKIEFNVWLKNVMERYNDSAWKNTIVKTNVDGESKADYFWGCNSDIMHVSNDAVIGSKLLGTYDNSIGAFARSSLNWILGMNPQRKSYVTSYGEDSIKTIFSYLYSYDNRAGVPVGYLAGGPNYSQGKGISKFPGKCYMESDHDWVSNENCLNWNAPLVFVSAFVNDEAYQPKEDVKKPEDEKKPTNNDKLIVEKNGTSAIVTVPAGMINRDALTVINPGLLSDITTVETRVPTSAIVGGQGQLQFITSNSNVTLPIGAIDFTGIGDGSYLAFTQSVKINDPILAALRGAKQIFEFDASINDKDGNKVRDIHKFKDGKEAMISLQLDEKDISDLDKTKMAVWYYNPITGKLEKLGGHFEDHTKKIVFYTSHFSQFVVGEDSELDETLPQTGSINNITSLVALGLVMTIAGIMLILRKRENMK